MRDRHELRKVLVRPVANEDGAILMMMVLLLLGLLGLSALAVDVGSMLNARSEAQRAADAGALAGAGLFRGAAGLTAAQIKPLARDTAYRFASLNSVGGAPPDSIGVSVWELDRKVGVEVIGNAPIFFARFLGKQSVTVRGYAEAQVTGAKEVTCVKPFALPDLWQSGATPNNLYDPGEVSAWSPGFNPARGDRYETWNGSLTHSSATGYGAPSRNGSQNWQGNSYQHDNGRKVVFKIGSRAFNPNLAEVPTFAQHSSDHFLLDLGSEREPIPGIDCNSGNPVTRNICQCATTPVGIGSQVQKEPGNVANTTAGLQKLINAAPNLSWDNVNQRVVDPHGNHVTDSPRIIKLVLYDPVTALATQGSPNGKLDVVNVGLFFLEGFDAQGQNVNVWGRFLQFASGSGVGSGSTALSLQLVR